MAEAYAADEVEFRLNGVAVAAVPVGTVIRATGEAGQVTVTARVTVTTRADGISDTVVQIDVAQSPGPPMFITWLPYAYSALCACPRTSMLALVNPRVKPRRPQTRQELPAEWRSAVV